MKNNFFASALKSAAAASGKPSRLLLLLTRLSAKLKEVNWKSVNTIQVKDKFSVLGRFVHAYALGKYRRDVNGKTILIIIAALIYFVNPIDLLPDLIPLTGLTDDFGVLLWVYNSVNGEIQKFLTWEKSQVSPS